MLFTSMVSFAVIELGSFGHIKLSVLCNVSTLMTLTFSRFDDWAI